MSDSSMQAKDESSSTPTAATSVGSKRGLSFWMVIISNLIIDLLSVLDLMAVSTALPTIVEHLDGTDFIWVGSAYTIASTAVIPLVGDLVSGFGRKPVLLSFIIAFAIGSAISGAAQNMNMLIAGRTIQGLGSGGCLACVEVVLADLVPLPERGTFQGITACVWSIGCAVGPPIGGALAASGAWRWLFFLNLPLCGISIFNITVFLNVRKPKAPLLQKLREMDWIGITIIVGSSVAVILALTWGGLTFPWNSPQVLAPLIIGVAGIVFFFVAERFWLGGRTVPIYFFTERTTLSGYLGTFFHGIVESAAIYYLPVYFQAVKGASAIGSGVDILPLTFMTPVAAIALGASVQGFRKYRPQNYFGWAVILIAFGVLTLLHADSSRAMYLGVQVPLGIGLGIMFVAPEFPILAPLPVSNNAHALAFFIFTRRFAESFGIAIGGATLQNVLKRSLPASYLSTLPQGAAIAYAVIPQISSLPPALRAQVRDAFARATRTTWIALLCVSGAGILTCLLMREEVMRESLDEQWGLQDGKAGSGAALGDVEKDAEKEKDNEGDGDGEKVPEVAKVEA